MVVQLRVETAERLKLLGKRLELGPEDPQRVCASSRVRAPLQNIVGDAEDERTYRVKLFLHRARLQPFALLPDVLAEQDGASSAHVALPCDFLVPLAELVSGVAIGHDIRHNTHLLGSDPSIALRQRPPTFSCGPTGSPPEPEVHPRKSVRASLYANRSGFLRRARGLSGCVEVVRWLRPDHPVMVSPSVSSAEGTHGAISVPRDKSHQCQPFSRPLRPETCLLALPVSHWAALKAKAPP